MPMRRRVANLAFAAALLALTGCTFAPANPGAATTSTATAGPRPTPIGPTERGHVAFVTDGDTVRVDFGFESERVRFVGINAPERGEAGYDEARDEVVRLVDAREVVLERDVSERDQYGRLLRYVWVDDGRGGLVLVNLLLVEGGFARARVYGPDDRYAAIFANAQQRAKDARLGIWASR